MPFVVNPKREVTFHHTITDGEEKTEFSVTFKFTPAEDVDYAELRKKMENKKTMEVEDEDGKITKTDMGTYNAFLYTLRTALSNWTNINDPEGNVLPVKDGKGKIIETNQIAVFEAVRIQKELFDKIILAYVGHKEKNS